jgi:probable F420-dependent oxidoreductase
VNVGVSFPQTQIGTDPIAIRDFAQAAEELGFTHLLAGEHVLGAPHDGREPKLTGGNTEQDAWHEPLVLFGYLAGVTTRIELATGILILPQRQTALVAKQAAEVDILSGERLRLGIGLGWNHVEYEALNENFANRGERAEEQVDVLRKLWSEPLLDYRGEWHRIDRASILPRPGREIPIWFGGRAPSALKRAARLGDGFSFAGGTPDELRDQLAVLRGFLAEAGRPPGTFGFEITAGQGDRPDGWREELEGLAAAGFTHVGLRTINRGFTNPQQHIDMLGAYRAVLQDLL